MVTAIIAIFIQVGAMTSDYLVGTFTRYVLQNHHCCAADEVTIFTRLNVFLSAGVQTGEHTNLQALSVLHSHCASQCLPFFAMVVVKKTRQKWHDVMR